MQVDKLIADCEAQGRRLLTVLESWTAESEGKGEEEGGMRHGVKAEEICLKSQPELLNGELTLKSYQLVGVSWLNLLYTRNLGGILADEVLKD
jgi:SWI/SNF-related matrix-associated actin-dependent regulator of chromatin subfamily A containing DEAD/H box 1